MAGYNPLDRNRNYVAFKAGEPLGDDSSEVLPPQEGKSRTFRDVLRQDVKAATDKAEAEREKARTAVDKRISVGSSSNQEVQKGMPRLSGRGGGGGGGGWGADTREDAGSGSSSTNLSQANRGTATSIRTGAARAAEETSSRRGSSNKTTTPQRSLTPTYPVYQKNSSEAQDFRKNFAAALKSGQSEFEWQGRKYNTKVK